MNVEISKKHPCYGCKYSCTGTGPYIFCEYIFFTGHQRPCPPGKDCTVKEKRKEKKDG